jgi:hypothetical protein
VSPPPALAVRCTLQRIPFQRSASGEPLELPTASQNRAVAQDTPSRIELSPSSLGDSCIDHLDPFQCSMSGELLTQHPDTDQPASPTASQLRAETQETSLNELADVSTPGGNLGLGVDCTDQVEPFHRSASVKPPCEPTAVHARVDAHEIASRLILRRPRGFGTVRADQRDPSQRSISAPLLSKNPPTAKQVRLDGHDTAENSPVNVLTPGTG